ncbi:putative ABC transporter ATP-binding protein YxlF [Planctomycetes bacterium Poly30]|uniref:Putative ABC transporter ATP-binding protein YxlF n=1 Tax=Saltatorellus ferox TaxID=2528018 RepID=A0A518ETX8_9BACT|nr:putative ABC transporter ATP-binding protein YxlF [Planctomycetes bacterium Poly30]
MSAIVQAEGLGRWYGEVVGLGDLTVSIEPGITGLVGPNGAGKSTFMKVMVGELRPHRGQIRVLGYRPFGSRPLYRRLGFCPQQDALYEHQTGMEFVRDLLRLGGESKRKATLMAGEAMERVGLTDAMNRKVSDYSKGMRQRTRLAQSIAHSPELVIADEPLTGLDPIARRQVLELFQELSREGKSVILSSHVLHEVESLTETIVLIHRGRLLAQGTVRDVRQLISRHPSRVRVTAREPRKLAAKLFDQPHVRAVSLGADGESIQIETDNVAEFHVTFAAAAASARAGVRSLSSDDASLEAVFDYLVG